jgi:hypothetical protein
MSAQIIEHPSVTASDLCNKRLYWISEANRFRNKGDSNNQAYCQGKAAGLNEAIVMLGGEGISMRLGDYEATENFKELE